MSAARRQESDEFYDCIQEDLVRAGARNVQRQDYAGMLQIKQFYSYNVAAWLDSDPAHPEDPLPTVRRARRNTTWRHLHNADLVSMPDKWEYPWVRGLGLGLPLPAAGGRGHRICQESATPAVPKRLLTPQRPGAGPRVEV